MIPYIDHGSLETEFRFNVSNELLVEDSTFNYDIFRIYPPLQPGDSIQFEFNCQIIQMNYCVIIHQF